MAGPNIYSATYSNIPVYEYQFGHDLKEHVMRRRHDDWINATHILKAAGFDKPARTRILEREVQKEVHEKVQGGYGKYQGTWVPLEHGEALAHRNNVYDKLRPIFEFVPGDNSPPPAPKHSTNKPKLPKKPAVPKWSNKPPVAAPRPSISRVSEDDPYDNISAQLNDDDTPDDTTVASASFMGEDDRYDMSQQSTGHRKRKRDEPPTPNLNEQAHTIYADELLDYFMLSQADEAGPRPEPPPNFQPDWVIDQEGHTAIHWAGAMGDVEVVRQLKRFGANTSCRNVRGETPLMRAVMFTNCQDKQTMPKIVQEFIGTVNAVDYCHSTAIHHAAAVTNVRSKHNCIRYYLDILLNKLLETLEPEEMARLLDAQDIEGNTACHIAARNKARKCVRALIGRGASTDIPNSEGQTAEQLIQELNNGRNARTLGASSSPFAPDSHSLTIIDPALTDSTHRLANLSHHSEAAMSIESKVTPLVLEKFHDLAKSFDEELGDRNDALKESKRILSTTNTELASVRAQIAELERMEAEEGDAEDDREQLKRVEAEVMSLIERRQNAQLMSLIAQQEQQGNGALMTNGSGNDLQERINLARQLVEAQSKRVALVQEYVEALSKAGMSEKGEMSRALIMNCLGLKKDEVDGYVEGLLGVLEEEIVDGNADVDMVD